MATRVKSPHEKRMAAIVTKFAREHRGLNRVALTMAIDDASSRGESLSNANIRSAYMAALAFDDGTTKGMVATRPRPTVAQENAELARLRRHAVASGYSLASARKVAASHMDDFSEAWQEAFHNFVEG